MLFYEPSTVPGAFPENKRLVGAGRSLGAPDDHLIRAGIGSMRTPFVREAGHEKRTAGPDTRFARAG
jgi:hypothetical protein